MVHANASDHFHIWRWKTWSLLRQKQHGQVWKQY